MDINENQSGAEAHVHARATDHLNHEDQRAVNRARLSNLAENKVVRGLGTAISITATIGGLIAAGSAILAGVNKVRNRNNGGGTDTMSAM